MPIIDDQALLKLMRSNRPEDNDEAFKHLYREFFTFIQSIILTNNGKDQDAEDIFQDTLIVLYHQVKKDNFILTSSLKTYLYSISRNLWLKKLRKSNKVVQLSDTLKAYIPIEDQQLKTLEVNEEKKIVAAYLEQLGQGCRDILLYFYFEKIKMSEIAEIMGLSSEQGAKNKKSVCMKKLRALIKGSKYFKTDKI